MNHRIHLAAARRSIQMGDTLSAQHHLSMAEITMGERIEDEYPLYSWAAFWLGMFAVGTVIGSMLTSGEKFSDRALAAMPYAAIAPSTGFFFVHVAPRLLRKPEKGVQSV